jgi:O-antigen/teichoic acid export membrane protein
MSILYPKILSRLPKFLTQGHERSVRAKKNIAGSLILKGLGIAISFIIVPITLDYVDSATYGIWLTLSSIVGWLEFFDIGLTQGLRNKFAVAKAEGDHNLAQIYVSTTYAILCIVFFIVLLIFLVVNNFLNWAQILNVSETMRPEVTSLAIIVFSYFCISFILRIVSTILVADQRPAVRSVIDLAGRIISLIIILILTKTTEGSVVKLGVAFTGSTLIILIAANLILFGGKYARYKPTFSKVRFSYAKNLFGLGIVFFIIQIASIIQFQTASIIIARNFGTADVTAYNIVYKYFGLLLMIFSIFLTPFWSASTEAFQKNDIQWIKNGMKRYNQLNLVMFLISLAMLVFSGTFYRLWLGEGKVSITFSLSLWGFIYYNVMMYGAKYVYLLNGLSALRIQFITSLISPVIYIAVVMILIRNFHLGVHAMLIASVIAAFNGYILAPLQYYMIIIKNKKGIWIKS